MNKVKKYALESVEITGKTALSLIPVGGALITSVYDSIKGNCLEKRQEEWRNTIETRLSKIEKTLDNIGSNEMFTTALVKATELAMKTSSNEKRIYLANAVANSLIPDITEEKLLTFLELLDQYTVSHIKIIHFFHAPTSFDNIGADNFYMGTPDRPLFMVYPELDNELFSKMYNDLYVDGMLSTDIQGLNVTMSGRGMVSKRTTPLGDDFLSFIMEDMLSV